MTASLRRGLADNALMAYVHADRERALWAADFGYPKPDDAHYALFTRTMDRVLRMWFYRYAGD